MTSLTVERRIDIDPARVWLAWTDPAELAAWMWPPSYETRCDVDLRPGGRFRLASETVGTGVAGEYLEIVEPERLVFTWRWDGEDEDTLVTVTLQPSGASTIVRIVHEKFVNSVDRDNHLQGWNDCLDRLPPHLAGD